MSEAAAAILFYVHVCSGYPAQRACTACKQSFPHKPSFTDHIRDFLLSVEFRSALQLTVGKSTHKRVNLRLTQAYCQ